MRKTIVSVAFREPYITHSKRQEGCIKALEPEVSYYAFRDAIPWRDGSVIVNEHIIPAFQSSLYGFKPTAIRWMMQMRDIGKIIWLDPSVLPITPMEVIFEALDKYPVLTITGANDLKDMCNQRSKDYFGLSNSDLEGFKHIAGTIYAFNFTDPQALKVFELWEKAEADGIFGTQDDFMKGHWADESCLALAMCKLGMKQVKAEGFRFLNQKDL